MISTAFYFKRAKLVYSAAGGAERVLRHSGQASRSHLHGPLQRRVSLHLRFESLRLSIFGDYYLKLGYFIYIIKHTY